MPIMFVLYCLTMATVCKMCKGNKDLICGMCKNTTNYYYSDFECLEESCETDYDNVLGSCSGESGEDITGISCSNEKSDEDLIKEKNVNDYVEKMRKFNPGMFRYLTEEKIRLLAC